MSTLKVNKWINSDGTENYKCRAWVNFNGTGTVAIKAGGNISSITDNGVGDYTINFTNAMEDADYVVTGSTVGTTSVSYNATIISNQVANSVSSFRIRTVQSNTASYFDYDNVVLAIHR